MGEVKAQIKMDIIKRKSGFFNPSKKQRTSRNGNRKKNLFLKRVEAFRKMQIAMMVEINNEISKRTRNLKKLKMKCSPFMCSLPETLMLEIFRYLSFADCAHLMMVDKTWLMYFMIPPFSLWDTLSLHANHSLFKHMDDAVIPSTKAYLNQWGCSLCFTCGMWTGNREERRVPISVFVTGENEQYTCINPVCNKPLDTVLGEEYSLSLVDVFDRCRPHKWSKEPLDQDLFLPGGALLDNTYDYCTKCGLLSLKSIAEERHCEICQRTEDMCQHYTRKAKEFEKHKKFSRYRQNYEKAKEYEDFKDLEDSHPKEYRIYWSNQTQAVKYRKYMSLKKYSKVFTCQNCEYCGKSPTACFCVICDECKRCQDCKHCTGTGASMCDCVFCSDCDKLVEGSKPGALGYCECNGDVFY